LTLEQGKPLSLLSTELTYSLTWLRAFSTMQLTEETLLSDADKTVYSTHLLIGVCAGIILWNWPI
jgi:acyl-CoA reductase-like NAD-dependent aldehyde dehydrogenase